LNGPPTNPAASPARLRATLIVILIACLLLGTAGFYYGRWLLQHPPDTAENLPGH